MRLDWVYSATRLDPLLLEVNRGIIHEGLVGMEPHKGILSNGWGTRADGAPHEEGGLLTIDFCEARPWDKAREDGPPPSGAHRRLQPADAPGCIESSELLCS
ncbi:hypothetical protein BHE74_00002165 [Ensete ventricosum]|nr:hypothetical protein BHE74_00002165 [Ensete ventricosum]